MGAGVGAESLAHIETLTHSESRLADGRSLWEFSGAPQSRRLCLRQPYYLPSPGKGSLRLAEPIQEGLLAAIECGLVAETVDNKVLPVLRSSLLFRPLVRGKVGNVSCL